MPATACLWFVMRLLERRALPVFGVALALALGGLARAGDTASRGGDAASANMAQPASHPNPLSLRLPPLPSNVTELKFSEFFEMPVGPFGLKPTQKLFRLDGKKVRILGYMVREQEPGPGLFILSPVPVSLPEIADGPADDLPPAVVFVHPREAAERVVPYTRGMLLLTGILSVGNKDEPNGRVSMVRLDLDPPQRLSSEARPE